jgi:Zn-dependent peptidase ImmA (M78 family)
MTQIVAGINPEVLKWARERAGYSVVEVATALKKDPESIRAWESGTESPTYVQLEKLAYQLYRRPIALFFFPEPPDETEPLKSFRTLPQNELQALSSDTRLALRQARAMQLALYELTGSHNTASNSIFRELRLREKSNVNQAANNIRNYLGVPLHEQLAWKDSRHALNNWREAVQNAGIFVFKRSFKQKDISGFCLLDEEFPVIYLNNSVSQTRQIFSLFHELAHILFGVNGVTKNDDAYISALTGRYKRIERFCNEFAAGFLVPHEDFSSFVQSDFYDDSVVEQLARRYSVSREVILRIALESRLVDSAHYERKAQEWARQANQRHKTSGGGNYYLTQATYLGDKYINLAFGRYYQGNITMEQLADYLNIKVKNIARFEPLVVGRMTA